MSSPSGALSLPADLPTDEELADLEEAARLGDDRAVDVLADIEMALAAEMAAGWVPQAKQALADSLAGVADELLYGGAAGGGKTEWLIRHMAAEMERRPRNRGVIFRRVFPSLARTIVPRAKLVLKARARYNEVTHTFAFPNGSVLELASLQYADSVLDYQGAEYGVIAFEEITEFLESQVEFMLGRLRSPAAGIRPHMIATTNPGGVGHRWVKRRYVRPDPADVSDGQSMPAPGVVWRPKPRDNQTEPEVLTRCFVPATLDDNPALLRRDPRYRSRLRAISNRGLRRALETGDWDAIDSVDGALWQASWLDVLRVDAAPSSQRRVVAVDPSDGLEAGDEYGVCVASRGRDGDGYVEHSDGWRMSPRKMAEATIEIYHDLQADAIAVERNHGGRWIETTLRSVDAAAKIKMVWASEGKRTRAEPVAGLFEPAVDDDDRRPRAHMVGFHEDLEAELTSFTGGPGEVSPNRLDALVWAFTELVIRPRHPAKSHGQQVRTMHVPRVVVGR